MEEIARTYADALFEVATQSGELDRVRDELEQFTQTIDGDRDLQVFLFSPYFSSTEKREGIGRMITGASSELTNFLELLAEKHRMPAIFRIQQRFDELWAAANRRLEVRLTSAIELDPTLARSVGSEIEKRTGKSVELTSEVDADILGGLVLRVGNMVLDASLRSKLERLEKEVAAAT